MATIEERQRWRDDYLVALYDLSEGNTLSWATHAEIAEQAGIPGDEMFNVGQFLSAQGLAEFMTAAGPAGNVAITAGGIQRAEDIIQARERSGAPRITGLIVFTDQELLQRLEPLLATIRKTLDESEEQFDPETRIDLTSDLNSIDIQLKASHPNRGGVRAALARIKASWSNILLGTSTVIPAIDIILRRLGH